MLYCIQVTNWLELKPLEKAAAYIQYNKVVYRYATVWKYILEGIVCQTKDKIYIFLTVAHHGSGLRPSACMQAYMHDRNFAQTWKNSNILYSTEHFDTFFGLEFLRKTNSSQLLPICSSFAYMLLKKDLINCVLFINKNVIAS